MKFENIVNNNDIKNIKYEIKKIKTYDDYVFIYLDEDKIQVSIDDYFKYNLSKIKGLDENLYNQLKSDETNLKAYRSCLRKLSIKDYTTKQIKDHLRKYNIDNNEVNNIIDKLTTYGLLNDEKYCINKINYYNKQSLSNRNIKQKLIKEGIHEDLINEHLVIDHSLEQDKADALALKYSRTINNKSINAKKQAIISKLVANGFTYDMANSSMYKLSINADNELELLSKEYLKVMNKYSKKYSDYELRNKIYSSLLSKGFKSDDIKKIMEV